MDVSKRHKQTSAFRYFSYIWGITRCTTKYNLEWKWGIPVCQRDKRIDLRFKLLIFLFWTKIFFANPQCDRERSFLFQLFLLDIEKWPRETTNTKDVWRGVQS